MDKLFVIKQDNEEKYFHFGSTFVESELDAHFFSSSEEAELVKNKIVNRFGIPCKVQEMSEGEKKVYLVKFETAFFVEAHSKAGAQQLAISRLKDEYSKARVIVVEELKPKEKT